MKIDESQKKQFIVLCVLIVIAVGYGATTLLGSGGSPATSTQSEHHAKRTEAMSASAPAPGMASELETAVPPVQSRDPFAPQIGPLSKSAAANLAQPAADLQAKPIPPVLPPVQVGPMPMPPGSAPSQQVQTAENDPTKQFLLTGVIRGARNVAVIRTGQTRSSIVREGQIIDGKYRVETISSGMVLIKHEGRTIVLRLGGNQVGARL